MTQTIFILAGGNDRASSEYGQRLGQEIAKHVDKPRILSCFFSALPETWEERGEDWKSWFTDHLTQPFTYDYARSGSFLEQIDKADAVYFHGGDTPLLLKTVPATGELRKHLQGKVVIGSSAGANMLSTYFWSSTKGEIGIGRGILDTCVMVHYGAPNIQGLKRTQQDWAQEKANFQKRIGDRDITPLPEGGFVTMEQDL